MLQMILMMLWHGNAFCIIGTLWRESTGDSCWWISPQRASDTKLWCFLCCYTPAQRSWRGGILDSPCPSVRLSLCPSVCRRHGFRSISQVCFGISISICVLMVAIGRSLLIFSDVTFKMAAWRPYWIFWFPDSNFTLALNINFKLQRHNTYVYTIFSNVTFKMAAWRPY